ncbi:monovalent cation:proton antiporter-2 (CPA2) family protein [Oceanobacter kriegii]|uniref:monovalent cation:proton antiporter-2 (CPA2) family protein n=1 Tax=Oceanobacter kriegii TaxID=64972 RepID=UPI000414C8A3|nr:monovalent cation:proton antiporter-2 (CPA2) family protein [Oceanobacter kriegii]
MTEYFIQAFIYLAAAVVLVPLAKQLGLGSVLGYLIAGVLIGPVLGLVGSETTTIQHFAEFGVVMMLFLVGLELQPKALWGIRDRLFGLGGLQVVLTSALVAVAAHWLGLQWPTAVAVGMILSLSSTAIVLQTLNEKNLNKTDGGTSAFSVLLFQDIAVIPMLALFPLLALPELQQAGSAAASHGDDLSLVAHLPMWGKTLAVLASVAAVVLGGHFLSRPLFRYVAKSHAREIFTATALMLVVGIAALMHLVGLSPALGAFLAGVVLASSEFRHEIESDMEPFKGLLLGLFFITVGAGVDFALLASQLLTIVGLTLALMLAKGLVLAALARLFKLKTGDRWQFAMSLAQAGEFGFVLLTYAYSVHVLSAEQSQLLSLVVALSMFLTPALFILLEKVVFPNLSRSGDQRDADAIEHHGPVIIAGVGRFGQVVNRLLVSNGFDTVLLDHKISQIELMRRINVKGYYGDATRPDLLETAGIAEASLLVIAIDEKKHVLNLVRFVKRRYPHVKIIARAFDRGHHYKLQDAGADFVITETYYSALEAGSQALRMLGYSDIVAEQRKAVFNKTEARFREKLYLSWRDQGGEKGFNDHYRGLVINLQEALYKAMQKADELDTDEAFEDDTRTVMPVAEYVSSKAVSEVVKERKRRQQEEHSDEDDNLPA